MKDALLHSPHSAIQQIIRIAFFSTMTALHYENGLLASEYATAKIFSLLIPMAEKQHTLVSLIVTQKIRNFAGIPITQVK